jgi:hypothetical protein
VEVKEHATEDDLRQTPRDGEPVLPGFACPLSELLE